MNINNETIALVLILLMVGWAAYVLIGNELAFRYRNKRYPFKK